MTFRLHYHRHGREVTSDHSSINDAVQFATAGEMADEMSVDFLTDVNGNIVLDEEALSKAVWGWR